MEIKVKPRLQHCWGGQAPLSNELERSVSPVILPRLRWHLTAVNLINVTVLSLEGRRGAINCTGGLALFLKKVLDICNSDTKKSGGGAPPHLPGRRDHGGGGFGEEWFAFA